MNRKDQEIPPTYDQDDYLIVWWCGRSLMKWINADPLAKLLFEEFIINPHNECAMTDKVRDALTRMRVATIINHAKFEAEIMNICEPSSGD